MSPTALSAWAAACTVTRTACTVLNAPVNARIRSAVVLPRVTGRASRSMRRPGMPVSKAKLVRVTPAAKVVSFSDTVRVAPCRVSSVRVSSVRVAVGPVTVIVTSTVAASAAATLASASWAVTTSVARSTSAGRPQRVRGTVPGQGPVPSASKFRPAGRPVTV